MIRTITIFLVLAAIGTNAGAEVKSSSSAGFESENKRVVTAAPKAIFDALGKPSSWWNRDTPIPATRAI